MLCDHRVFMLPESCSKVFSTAGKPGHITLRQSRPYQLRSCFLFRRTLRVEPFLRWPALKRLSSTHRFQLGTILSANLYSSSIYNTSSQKLEYEDIMREWSWVCIGETGNEGKLTPQSLQHEVMNQSFQADMRTSWVRLSKVHIYRRDGKWGQTKTTTTTTWGNEPIISNGSMHLHHTSHPVYFFFWKIS